MANISFEESLEEIEKLVDKFDKNFHNKDLLNEEDVKQDYINSFLLALGWDVGNKANKHENKRDVKFEEKVNVKEGKNKKTKFVDYSMRIGGESQFYLEAKQPSKNIKEDNTYSFQLRRYGFSAGLPLNILTDFEELSIYDCRIKPKASDSTLIGQKYYFEYKYYFENWKTIWDLFSREAVENGSLDYYREKKIKGTSRVDKEFLEYIEKWRKELAQNICLRNRSISEANLNYAVQKIIDRIIFLRMCESRSIEVEETLKQTIDNIDTYKNLIKLFKEADEKYNSGLFHFKKEDNILEEKDDVTPNLIIDSKILNNIIESLYDSCPYEFSVFSADILGRVYEQFLGKVVSHKESSTRVSIEEKMEVRKSGGVYYTPEYIVKYIVEHTIGTLVENKKIKDIEKIRVIDPACGSGSFLIVAYQFLLDKHLDSYIDDGAEKYIKGKNPILFKTEDGIYQLTLEERKKILLNNIYGVDIDVRAVEVTKLSLLLKVLEYEGEEIKQRFLFNERVLPDLFNNIKCGNSLVESDISIDAKELLNINPFDWGIEFKEIMNNGGFDCVIGNPPYVDSEEMVKSNLILRNYATQNKYVVAKGNWDMYCIFVERGNKILKKESLLGYIIPNKFLSMSYGDALREYLSNYQVKEIVDYSSVKVFYDFSKEKNVAVYPIILIMNKNSNNKKCKYKKIIRDDYLYKILYEKETNIKNKEWADKLDVMSSIIKKIEENNAGLGIYCLLESSATTSEAYIISDMVEDIKYSNKYFKLINSGTIDRYNSLWNIKKTQYIKKSYQSPCVDKELLGKKFPKRAKLSNSEKIIFANMTKCIEGFFDKNKEYYAGKSTTVLLKKDVDLRLILAIVNSKVFNMLFFAKNKYTAMQGGALNIDKNKLSVIPCPNLFEIDNKYKNTLIDLVEKIINLLEEVNKIDSKEQKKIFEKQIEKVDSQIDKIVYVLYGVDKEEIALIDSNFGGE